MHDAQDETDGFPEEGSDAEALPRVRWGIARSAALVFLGVALAVGAALFLVRSSEPSAAAVSVELDAGERGTAAAGDSPVGTSGRADATTPDAAVPPEGSGSAPEGAAGAGSASVASGTGGGDGTPPSSEVVVYVTGAVATPGVVSVPSGTRLVDVLDRAGGPLQEADLEGINLAGMPVDGQHIHVLVIGEEPRAEAIGPPGVPSTDGTGSAPGDTGGGATGGVLDINTATLAEIEALPRVGPVLGQRIIEWRETQGSFERPEDIDAVPGIGPALLEGILPLITVR